MGYELQKVFQRDFVKFLLRILKKQVLGIKNSQSKNHSKKN